MTTTDAFASAVAEPDANLAIFSRASRRRMMGIAEFLAVGGLSLVILPFAIFAPETSWLGLTGATVAGIWLVYVINDPHFAASYLIFYRNIRAKLTGQGIAAGERWRYWSAGVVMPGALFGWLAFAMATTSAWMLSWAVQAMFILVGWHYIKQGFGVLVVLSARRGIRFDGRERLAILVHAYSAWALAWTGVERFEGQGDMDGIAYVNFNLPEPVYWLALTVFWASAAVLLIVLGRKFLAARQWPPLTPFTGFFVTLYLWQVLVNEWLALAFLVPALHSLQYLVFVSRLETGRAREAAKSRPAKGRRHIFLWRIALFAVSALGLGWLIFHAAPNQLDAAVAYDWETLGPTAFLAAISVFVNIHHYLMDNVIWRRGNPETRHLFS